MIFMSLSSEIANILIDMLDVNGSAEIQRNELAQSIGCVPSQINYVISSRFTPEHGYIVESRRGGGGYIKITRLNISAPDMIMHAVNSIGDRLDSMSSRAFIVNLAQQNFIKKDVAEMMLCAVSDNALRPVEPEKRDETRASILKQMLLSAARKAQ
jgi:transcriptional regulator CtsR